MIEIGDNVGLNMRWRGNTHTWFRAFRPMLVFEWSRRDRKLKPARPKTTALWQNASADHEPDWQFSTSGRWCQLNFIVSLRFPFLATWVGRRQGARGQDWTSPPLSRGRPFYKAQPIPLNYYLLSSRCQGDKRVEVRKQMWASATSGKDAVIRNKWTLSARDLIIFSFTKKI